MSEEQQIPQIEDIHHLEQQRRTNRQSAAELGLLPYGHREDGLVELRDAHEAYDESADEANKASVQARKEAKKSDPEMSEDALPALVDDARW